MIFQNGIEFISDGEKKPGDKYFGSALQDTALTSRNYLRFKYDQITEVWERRFQHLHTAIEIFLRNGKSYYFNLFAEDARDQVI
jgi:hypothetical protein